MALEAVLEAFIYSALELIGAAAAAGVFMITHEALNPKLQTHGREGGL